MDVVSRLRSSLWTLYLVLSLNNRWAWICQRPLKSPSMYRTEAMHHVWRCVHYAFSASFTDRPFGPRACLNGSEGWREGSVLSARDVRRFAPARLLTHHMISTLHRMAIPEKTYEYEEGAEATTASKIKKKHNQCECSIVYECSVSGPGARPVPWNKETESSVSGVFPFYSPHNTLLYTCNLLSLSCPTINSSITADSTVAFRENVSKKQSQMFHTVHREKSTKTIISVNLFYIINDGFVLHVIPLYKK